MGFQLWGFRVQGLGFGVPVFGCFQFFLGFRVWGVVIVLELIESYSVAGFDAWRCSVYQRLEGRRP